MSAHKGELVVDTRYEFQAMGLGPLWECRYRVYAVADGMVVVFSESPDSALPVPLLHVEQLASEVLPNVVETPEDRDRVTWIIHLPCKQLPMTSVRTPEMFAHVTFKEFFRPDDRMGMVVRTNLPSCKHGWFARPEWSRATVDEVESMIGMEWEPVTVRTVMPARQLAARSEAR